MKELAQETYDSLKRWFSNPKNVFIFLSLVAILLLGLFARTYHAGYPTVGYHNMKEAETLSFAWNMKDDGDFLRTAWDRCAADQKPPCYFNEGESPVFYWFLNLWWLIFGVSLLSARLFIIAFSLGAVLLTYATVRKLTSSLYPSLLSALLVAVLPLSVFFGRNVQPDAAALFFLLLGIYGFLEARENEFSGRWHWVSILSLTLTLLFKVTFIFAFAYILFFIPYKEIWADKKKYFPRIAGYGIPPIAFFAWILLASILMPESRSGTGQAASLFLTLSFDVLSPAYWAEKYPILKSFFRDNWSLRAAYFFILGLILSFIHRTNLSKFVHGGLIGLVAYHWIFMDKILNHNYYYFPWIPLAAGLITITVWGTGRILMSFTTSETSKKVALYAPLVTLTLLITPFIQSTTIMYDTQFPGFDHAAEFVRENTDPSQGVLWVAGGQNEPDWHLKRNRFNIPGDYTAAQLEELEEAQNIQYAVVHQRGFLRLRNNPAIADYIQNTYGIEQAGLLGPTPETAQTAYIIYKKGLNSTEEDLQTQPIRQAKTYEYYNRPDINLYTVTYVER